MIQKKKYYIVVILLILIEIYVHAKLVVSHCIHKCLVLCKFFYKLEGLNAIIPLAN